MNKIYSQSKTLVTLSLAATLTAGCMESFDPTDVLTKEQVSAMASAQEGLLNGIISYMVTYDSWGSGSAPTNDWGYPCQMFFREVQGADFPVLSSSYSYWYSIEAGTETRYTPYYTYRFYYNFIRTCNDLIAVIDTTTANATSLNYLGAGYAFRAMAYFDLTRMYEFRATGVKSLDQKADELGVWGLTMPIVTPDLTISQLRKNPRVDYATMYRFILTDLDKAETYIDGYTPDSKTAPDLSVVQGLKARFWLELATRMEEETDRNHIIQEDAKEMNGYHKLGVTTAADCYEKAQQYARLAMTTHRPMTQAEWQDPTTGFNTPNDAWMWSMSVSTKEQLGYYYCSFPGTICSEPKWGMARGYKAFRMIGSSLYNSIPADDWRRASWIDPSAAGTDAGYAQYKDNTLLSAEDWKELPAYANTKFRVAKDGLTDWEVGALVDLPLMRVEEMYLIDAECTAHLQGVASGVEALKAFVNTYRCTEGSYIAGNASTMEAFNAQLVLQKRIEFWGEGITYFDLKRLKQQVRRKDNTNYEESFMFNSIEGYVAPWMNYYILDYEIDQNPAVIPNPDTSGSITVTTNNK